jgi:hypothetical protein
VGKSRLAAHQGQEEKKNTQNRKKNPSVTRSIGTGNRGCQHRRVTIGRTKVRELHQVRGVDAAIPTSIFPVEVDG